MAETPSKVPWLDRIKRTGQLTIGFDGSLGKAGWDSAFKSAIFEFNTLSNNHRLGVTFVQAQDPKTADVEARAEKADFEFEYPPNIPKKKIKFDGKDVHGLCKPLLTEVRGNQFRLMKAFIYVPATPMGESNGKSRVVGDPVKVVIAVHEMIHACGLVENKEHSVDDVFSWPQLRMGNQPADDRLATLGGRINIPVPAGHPPRTGHSTVNMPPLFLKPDTVTKVRNLWN